MATTHHPHPHPHPLAQSVVSQEQKQKHVVVIGAGVIGLTTALKLQRHGAGAYQVTIVAEIVPSDPKSIKYTSRWAGAHHVYNPLNETDQHLFEEETFKVFWELSEPGSDAEESFLRVPQTEHFFVDPPQPNLLEKMPNFRQLTTSELIPGARYGCTFTTVTIDVPIYLNYLLTRFLALGGRIVRGSVIHIDQIVEGGTELFPGGAGGAHGHAHAHAPAAVGGESGEGAGAGEPRNPSLPDAVIVCAGIGARFLGGVEDKAVYPVRGQTVLVRAPWVRFGRTETLGHGGHVRSQSVSQSQSQSVHGEGEGEGEGEGNGDSKGNSNPDPNPNPDEEAIIIGGGGGGGAFTYIIPRRSSDVIVGGTRSPNDWYPLPRSETTLDILTRGLKLCPELAPPEVRAVREPSVRDVLPLVVGEGCGLRPARRGGVRVELEWVRERGRGTGRKGWVPVVHNYGHGGFGYQASWGCATRVLELLNDAFENPKQ